MNRSKVSAPHSEENGVSDSSRLFKCAAASICLALFTRDSWVGPAVRASASARSAGQLLCLHGLWPRPEDLRHLCHSPGWNDDLRPPEIECSARPTLEREPV